MRAPDFWSRRGPAALALAPFSVLYAAGAGLRQAWSRPHSVGVPVVCVGNLTVGGAGKTPAALALATLVRALGLEPHFLTRGYGGRLAGPVRVDPAMHSAADIGDEPLLLAAEAPCWVSRDRVAGAEAAIAAGAQAIVMDDGFQNPSLRKTVSFVVVDGEAGFGNGLVLPAGPLRERIPDGLRRATALVLVHPATEPVRRDVAAVAGVLPVLSARFEIDPAVRDVLRGRTVVAFAGLGRPDKFFASLRALDCSVAGAVPFPDHHPYRMSDIEMLRRRAAEVGAVLATTAKDHVRLPPEARGDVIRVDGRLAFEAPGQVESLLAAGLSRGGPGAT